MNFRWNNIAALLLIIVALFLVSRFGPQTKAAMDSIQLVGASHSSDERLAGFMVCGLIGVCIVAIVKILTHQTSNRGRRPRNGDDETGEE